MDKNVKKDVIAERSILSPCLELSHGRDGGGTFSRKSLSLSCVVLASVIKVLGENGFLYQLTYLFSHSG